ncbi:MAG: alcohol dehydrogenase catalytic domain-containing protein [Clostridia bacterium]|jgi:ribitol-5-phosphate 2-dehydrogenase|nr:alcohol dehydrogenase catalytic domain-containing protein [Clostridia bacterium]
MINEIVKLIDPNKFELFFKEEELKNEDYIIVKPTYMSICAADQRYYQGKRSREILNKKLPLTLIHECVGKVVYDSKDEFKQNERVVLIPNTPTIEDEIIKENYRKGSYFRSSNMDGFMQNVVCIRRDRCISIEGIKENTASLLELMSVSVNAIENFKANSIKKYDRIGVWGPGSVGYITYILLKECFPEAKIAIIGTSQEKLNYYPFADEKYLVTEIDDNFKVDHAFECVGGVGSEIAVNQIIDHINPQGSISLLGVSEEPIRINTRMVLEKGLTLLGDSRSGYEDFDLAVKMLRNPKIQEYVEKIISEEVEINSINDIYKAFDSDITNGFKTVMKWNM